MAKPKYYAVWKGRKTGIFTSWDECNKQVSGFSDGGYELFDSLALAEEALKNNIDNEPFVDIELTIGELNTTKTLIEDCICVDSSCNTQNGLAEYQGVKRKSGELIFRMGPFKDGTNNIVEFLAIVHALIYCQKSNIILPIYSDSVTAICWVKNKKANTKHPQSESNKKLFEMVAQAEKWLNQNQYSNKILKWETNVWGEIPADFGRK